MAHNVICAICGRQFDRDKIQAVKHGARRYSHFDCEPDGEIVPLPPKKEPKEKTEEEIQLDQLKDYIASKYGSRANWALINKQIKTFHEVNKYSYSGMLKSLMYFLEVKGNTVEKSNGGIGIIEYCYQDAYNYYLSIYLAQQSNDIAYVPMIKEYVIPIPKARGIKNRLLNWSKE